MLCICLGLRFPHYFRLAEREKDCQELQAEILQWKEEKRNLELKLKTSRAHEEALEARIVAVAANYEGLESKFAALSSLFRFSARVDLTASTDLVSDNDSPISISSGQLVKSVEGNIKFLENWERGGSRVGGHFSNCSSNRSSF